MDCFKIENLSFSYPDCEKPALDNINITINEGEFLLICGKSGCGKSTLLRHLKPVVTPHGTSKGTIHFFGSLLKEVSSRELASRIGFVCQNPDNQIVTDKVWHEMAFGLESLGEKKESIRLRVAEMSAFFGVTEWFDKDVNTLSGGQKQLLNLASIMVCQPDVLILDEPTSQLDPIAASDFFNT
ncbi:MAG: ABC transporter ATP-binding protein, partial [Oscillospiraceae bacterium]